MTDSGDIGQGIDVGSLMQRIAELEVEAKRREELIANFSQHCERLEIGLSKLEKENKRRRVGLERLADILKDKKENDLVSDIEMFLKDSTL